MRRTLYRVTRPAAAPASSGTAVLVRSAKRFAGETPIGRKRRARKMAKVLAETRGVPYDHVARETTENFFRLFQKVPRPTAVAA